MNPQIPGRRETLLALGAVPLALQSGLARAQGAPPQEGTDYHVLPRQVPTDPADKIVVLDFFRYGCPHCFDFLTYVEAWQKRQPADVVVQRVPVAFDESQVPQARTWFSLLALGRTEDLHRKVFEAIHVAHHRLDTAEDIADFMAANGIARDKWLSVFNSFSMGPSVRRARENLIAYAIDGTPILGVDGRFTTAPSMMRNAGSGAQAQEMSLGVVDYLVARTRAERKRRTK
jgi:thiol:disulfide interchange protein DsbA